MNFLNLGSEVYSAYNEVFGKDSNMATIRFGGALNKVEFTKTGKISGGKLSPAHIRELVTRSINPTQLIPVELLDSVAADFARTGTWNSSHKGIQYTPGNAAGTSRGSISGELFDSAKAGQQISGLAKSIARVHYAYYAALLKSMNEVVQNPGVPAAAKRFSKRRGKITGIKKDIKFSRPVTLRVDELPGKPFSNRIRLSGRWAGLAEATIEAKQASGREMLFWKHTGEASQAFDVAVKSRLAKIKPRDFMVSGLTPPTITGDSLATKGAGKRVARAKYSFKLGIPSWDAKMDALITLPYANGQLVSTLTAAGLSNRRKLRGIDRILAAEAYRPWLRDLAVQAGQARDAHIRGSAFTSRTSPIVSGAISNLQKSMERVQKKIAEQKGDNAAPSLTNMNAAKMLWAARKK